MVEPLKMSLCTLPFWTGSTKSSWRQNLLSDSLHRNVATLPFWVQIWQVSSIPSERAQSRFFLHSIYFSVSYSRALDPEEQVTECLGRTYGDIRSIRWVATSMVSRSRLNIVWSGRSFSRKASRGRLCSAAILIFLSNSLSTVSFCFVSSEGSFLQLKGRVLKMMVFGRLSTNDCWRVISGSAIVDKMLFDCSMTLCFGIYILESILLNIRV